MQGNVDLRRGLALQPRAPSLAPTPQPRPHPPAPSPDGHPCQVLELQQGLARRAHAAEAAAVEMRQRQLASLRAEHAHAMCEVREEHEDVSRRTLRRAQRVQGLALALLPRVQHKARLRLAWVGLCGGVEVSKAERSHAEEARRLRAEVSDERERGAVEAAAAAKEAEMRAGWAAAAEREAATAAAAAAAATAAQQEQQLALMATQRDATAAERAAEQGVAEAARALAQQADATKVLLFEAQGRQEAAAEAALSEQRHLLMSAEAALSEQRRAAAMAVANAAEAHTTVAELQQAVERGATEAAQAAVRAAAELAAVRQQGAEEARAARGEGAAAVAAAQAEAAAAVEAARQREAGARVMAALLCGAVAEVEAEAAAARRGAAGCVEEVEAAQETLQLRQEALRSEHALEVSEMGEQADAQLLAVWQRGRRALGMAAALLAASYLATERRRPLRLLRPCWQALALHMLISQTLTLNLALALTPTVTRRSRCTCTRRGTAGEWRRMRRRGVTGPPPRGREGRRTWPLRASSWDAPTRARWGGPPRRRRGVAWSTGGSCGPSCCRRRRRSCGCRSN